MKAGAPAPGSALGTVFRRQLGELARGFALPVLAALIMSFLVLSAGIGAGRHRAEQAAWDAARNAYQAELQGLTVDRAAELLHPAIKPPRPLAFLISGEPGDGPVVYRQALSAWVPPELGRLLPGPPWRAGLGPLDWVFVAQVVLSLGAFLLGHDAICGERQSGTLRLVMSYPIPPWQLLAGKFLALWLCLAVPFLAGGAVALGILAHRGGPTLGGEDWLRLGGVAGLCLWAAALAVLVALLVSTLSRDAARCLGVLALIWVASVEGVPAAASLLAQRLQPVAGSADLALQLAAVRDQVERGQGDPGGWRGRDAAKVDGYALERQAAATQNHRAARQREIRQQAAADQLRQAELMRRLAAVSPLAQVRTLAEHLGGTGPERDRRFLAQAEALRQQLAAWLEAADGQDPASPHLLFFPDYLSQRPVDVAAMPRFALREASLAADLAAAAPGLLLLALETLAVAAAAVFCLQRQELT